MSTPSPHEKIKESGQRQPDNQQPDKGGSELNKVEYSEAEADPNIGDDFDGLSQEEWNKLLTSYSSEKEKERLIAHRDSLSLATYQNCDRSPPDNSRGSPKQAEDNAWPALLRTIQSMADVPSYHSAKMDVQVGILSSVATLWL
ncbi:hypothetical protein NDU88_002840 [Pleurodeles waltl]|uniref:Uncharacterized protein n=1 Tax=Pleurodeles waltl TaxID=8319 RepID=A0AAV7VE06_PLEWA|nr:hypothetical protein NDU88_002840 [Pleurodeles waltl]